jgi:alkanesulfonate monooxygenase SsuD/methylene tetrahydromethanopterin reductase-like flavin-dependent oxidoreductase (luciferase family)
VAQHAGHWNVWGGPATLAHKGKILDQHCAELGRDAKALRRSANMALLISDDRDEVARLAAAVSRRMGFPETLTHDLLLAGSASAVGDKLARLREAGVETLFVPSMFLPRDPRPVLDRFMSEVAPGFR